MSTERDWFEEAEVLWPGQKLCLEVTERLHREQTGFQDLEVMETRTHGRLLALDGVIQLTERDECAYHEMMVHVPMRVHGNASRVLVVGGGDGGAVREVLRHPQVEEVVLCELDAAVTAAARKYIPATACGLDDPRVTIVHEEAAGWLASCGRQFDVIIVDSSDPVGPAETLITDSFYASLRDGLAPSGVVVAQAESVWLHAQLIAEIVGRCKGLWEHVAYYWQSVPTYPSGQIGWVICSEAPVDRVPEVDEAESAWMGDLKIYSPAVHAAAFVLAPMHTAAIGLDS